MATIINNPERGETGNGLATMILALLAIIVVLAIVFYGLPLARRIIGGNVPATNSITIPVPDRVDVNINRQPGS